MMNAVTRIESGVATKTADDVVRELGGALLSIKDICAWTGKDRATIYRWIAAGKFPTGKAVGAGSRLWTRSEVQAWMDERS